MTSMASDPDPSELYVHPVMQFGMAGRNQSKEEVWSLETHMNAQISMPGITLPNVTSSTQHSLEFCSFQDYLPPLPTMNNLHLHSGALPATSFAEYNGGGSNMIHQPPEESADYGSPHIGLSLTQQTYYSSAADTAASFNNMLWRSRFGYLFGHQTPRCQADGCRADLSSAKRYHRRHKVCEFHSKASVVIVGGGQQQRFCQQCSRFHSLDEFDEAKKSCRKRLADHNRRRRKLQPPSLSTTTDPQARIKTMPKKKTALRDSTETSTIMRKTSSGINRVNHLDVKVDKGSSKLASSSRVGSSLSLGTVGELEKPCLNLHNQFNHEGVPHVIREDDSGHLQLQQQLSPFSHSTYHEAFQSAGGGPEMSYQQQSSLLHGGHLMFGLDFI